MLEIMRITKRYSLLAALVCISMSALAQLSETDKKILAYDDCFHQFSNSIVHDHTYNIGGQQVPVVEQTDFATRQFSQVDPQLDNVKLMIMDNKDLSKWERTDARLICQNYFSEGKRGFHIAAHGLQDANDGSYGKIKVGGKELGPEETANLIMQTLNDYEIVMNVRKEPFPIVLHTCNSGVGGEKSFAAKLSSILAQKIKNVSVIASPGILECVKENGEYNEHVIARNTRRQGNWLVFQNGKQTMQGTSDYKSTVMNVLGN